jgi:hypothetical protein
MPEKMAKTLRWMRLCVLASAVFMIIGIASMIFGRTAKTRFGEIDVERLNIVEKDGQLRLVIANKELTPGPIERGVPFGYGSGRRTGLIFYNDEGTECGGLAFGSSKNGSKHEAGAILAFDQYDQDQAIAFQHYENDSRRYSGITIAEYPTGITNKQRSERYDQLAKIPESPAKQKAMGELDALGGKGRGFFGRAQDGAAVLKLMDPEGNVRLRLRVDATGTPRIEFLDAKGIVIKTIAE